MKKKYCVIVDAFSSSRDLAAEFTKRGYQCIHVFSPIEKLPSYSGSYRSEDFAIEIQERNDINKIIEQLEAFPIQCIVAGTDPAVPFADELAARLELKQNELATTDCRRNKYRMAQCLAEKGLPHVMGFKSKNSEEIIAWANKHDLWPIIIKPTDGAGMEGLTICHHPEEVQDALQYLLTKKSFLGHTFQEPLAQPFLQGKEYIVNTVSCNGEIYISDIWESNNFFANKKIAYDTIVLMPAQGEVQDRLAEYMLKVIDALGFELGPAHSEVMLTNKGPILIEVNGRVMGMSIPNELLQQALENTQVSLTVDAFVDPKSFARRTTAHYKLKKKMACISYYVKYDNCVVNESALELIKKLPSFKLQKFSATGAVPKTIDLMTSPGWVILIHENMDVINNDMKKIREIEEKHLFVPNK